MIEIPDIPYWLISVIAFVLAAIARDKEWHMVKVFFYVVGVMTGACAAILIWVRNFMFFV